MCGCVSWAGDRHNTATQLRPHLPGDDVRRVGSVSERGARETVHGAGDKREGVQGLWAQILHRESREVGPEKAGCFFKS